MKYVVFCPILISVQPAELAKLSAVTALAYIMAKNQQDRDVSVKGLVLSTVVVAVFGALMYQSGLTNTLLLMCISGSMFLIGGARWRKLLIMGIVYVIVIGIFFVWKSAADKRAENMKKLTATEATTDSPAKVDRTALRNDRMYNWHHRDSLIYDSVTSYNSQEMFSIMAFTSGSSMEPL